MAEEQKKPGTDYQGNAKKNRGGPSPGEKNLGKVVSGEVRVAKKGVGGKIKDLFIAADFRTVMSYIAMEVLLPAARNMIVDGATKGVERMMYGERPRHRGIGPGPRITYNSPINRDREYRDPRTSPPGRSTYPRHGQNDFILASRDEANLVLENMQNVLEVFEVVSMSDLKELLGLPTSHIDQKWGWYTVADVEVRQVREGYLLDFPPAEALN